MSSMKTTFLNRVLAAILSLLMVITLIPLSSITTSAATENHPDYITITVRDKEGTPIPEASVEFVIDSVVKGNGYITSPADLMTDEYGCVEVMPSTDYVADDLTITATITKDGYKENTLISGAAIDAADKNFEVELEPVVVELPTIDNVTITASENLVYDGTPKELFTIEGTIPGDIVKYQIGEEEEVTYKVGEDEPIPAQKTDAKSYSIKVTVERENHTSLKDTFTVAIEQAKISVTFEPTTSKYVDGGEFELVQNIVGADKIPSGCTVRWLLKGDEFSTDINDIPKASAIGAYEVTLEITGNPNYKDYSYTPNRNSIIENGDLDLGDLVIQGIDGTYSVDADTKLPLKQDAIVISNQGDYRLAYILSEKDTELVKPL